MKQNCLALLLLKLSSRSGSAFFFKALDLGLHEMDADLNLGFSR